MNTRRPLPLLRTIVLASAVAAQIHCARTTGDDQVVATVAGREITLAEVDRRWTELDPASRMQARQQMYDGRARALSQIIGERMIALEASAKGMGDEQLVQTEIARRIQAITEEDIVRAYREAGDQSRPLAEVRSTIQHTSIYGNVYACPDAHGHRSIAKV